MALKKQITLPNGVPMEYHRILQINNVVNSNTVLVIRSYINQEQRNREKYKEIEYSDDIYTSQDFALLPYNDTLTIREAYEYLKTTEKYEGAEDVFDEDDEEMINDEKANNEMA